MQHHFLINKRRKQLLKNIPIYQFLPPVQSTRKKKSQPDWLHLLFFFMAFSTEQRCTLSNFLTWFSCKDSRKFPIVCSDYLVLSILRKKKKQNFPEEFQQTINLSHFSGKLAFLKIFYGLNKFKMKNKSYFIYILML